MNETYVTVQGNVTGDPVTGTSSVGDSFTFFRIASTVRRQNREGLWEDAYTSWFDVKTWRGLAANCAASVKKGQAVIVRGRLRTTSFERADGSTGSGLEIDASVVGHDLNRGTAEYVRGARTRGAEVESDPALIAARAELDASAPWPDPAAEPSPGATDGASDAYTALRDAEPELAPVP